MKVAVFGATGMVGSAIVEEGQRRGHEVVRVSTREDAADVQANLFDTDSVVRVARDVDAVVISVPPSRTGGPHEHWVEAHRRLAATELPARLLMVGGAGSTHAGDRRLLDTPGFPEAYRAEAVSAADVLDIFRGSDVRPDWTILSPAPVITPGQRTGAYRTGDDEVVGESVSTQDFAVAMWDELEHPQHSRARFTVAN